MSYCNGCAERDRQIAALKAGKRELQQMHRDRENDAYWAWQGDGEDHVESLVCPILISAEAMRGLLSQLAALKDENESLKDDRDRLKDRLANEIGRQIDLLVKAYNAALAATEAAEAK